MPMLDIVLSGRVRQFGGIPELIGREGVVDEFFEDEKGHIHCHVLEDDGGWFWCPSYLLEVQASIVKG